MDVDKVKGPGGADPNKETGKKDKVKGDEFKEFMRVDAVRETDPEQSRNRKQRAEDVEEGEDSEADTEVKKEDVPKFSLEDTSDTGPATAQAAGEAPPRSRMMGALDNVREPSSLTPVKAKSSAREIDLSRSELPASKPKPQPEAPPKKEPPTQKEAPPKKEETKPPPPASTEEKEPEKPEPPVEKPQAETKEAPPIKTPLPMEEFILPQDDLIEKMREAEKKGTLPIEPQPVLEETASRVPPHSTSDLDQKEEVNLEGALSQNIPLAPLPDIAPDEKEKIAPLEETAPTPIATPSPTPPPPPFPAEVTAPTPPPPYTQLSSHTLALFERMVGVITVMQTAGVSETTLHLSSEQFSSSVFFGAKIIISEDKNARNQFNIEIQASPEATVMLNQSLPLLVTSFAKGGYQFEVKQIKVSITEEEGDFRRKPKVGDEESGKEEQDQP